MKKNYSRPELKATAFVAEDIIRTSSILAVPETGDGKKDNVQSVDYTTIFGS